MRYSATRLQYGTVLVSPAWSAEGRVLFVSRYRPSLNSFELWRYALNGRTTLLVPVNRPVVLPPRHRSSLLDDGAHSR